MVSLEDGYDTKGLLVMFTIGKYDIWINCLKLCCGLRGVIPRTLDEQKDWMIEEKQVYINSRL